ncbi:MAG: leucine-rich repeat protein [Clostridia bacterium]|nr:leucine-rich repeat protein [Clostridia bacterium]
MKKAIFLGAVCSLLLIAAFAGCSLAGQPRETESEKAPKNELPRWEHSDFSYDVITGTGTVEIMGYNGSDADIAIPTTLNGYPVVRIVDYAFHSNEKLRTASIPETVTEIGLNPFLECSALESISVAEENSAFESIDGVLFSKGGEEKTLISYPKAKETEEYAVPEGVTAIGADACYRCGMRAVTFPETVTSIGDRAFAHSGNLRTIHLTGSTAYIGESAFGVCQKLESLALPEGVETIGNWAFVNSLAMTWVSLPSTVRTIGKNPFYYCQNLCEIEVDGNNPVFESVDGVLFNKEEHVLISYPMDDGFARQYRVPEGTEVIGEKAFWSVNWGQSLEEIFLPDGLVSIEAKAFAYSSIKKLRVPESVSMIDKSAFDDCSLTIKVKEGSYAQTFCEENGLTHSVGD